MNARRMSTLRQLVRGPSLHNRSRSTGDMGLLAQEATALELPLNNLTLGEEPIEQWRKTVLDAVDGGTPPAINDQSSSGSNPTIGDDSLLAAAPYLTSFDTEGRISPGLVQAQAKGRRATLSDMDLMYHHQQQQQAVQQQQAIAAAQQQMHMQMQMQQAQQMQQMAQFQQYQQALQVAAAMQQQQQLQLRPYPPGQTRNKAANRLSVSGMDLLIQREHDKAELLRKPKRINPSTVQVEGMLAKLPEQGIHNINFQNPNIRIATPPPRVPMNDYNASSQQYIQGRSIGPVVHHQQQQQHHHQQQHHSEHQKGQGHRMKNTDARRRAEMLRNEASNIPPRPLSSMSTPSNQPMMGQYMPMVMNQMQMPLQVQNPMGMVSSRSLGNSSRPMSMMGPTSGAWGSTMF
ncbi:hypothetical protein CLU79DRAFT_746707 [Phycomyces nitens]|nr:hypothetical protein CLU79DRAFT_746707 [Phycomyces nitens]